MHTMMIKTPMISSALQKKHPGDVVISLHGKILGIGKNSIQAFKEAKKKLPNIDDQSFLISRIHGKVLVA